MSSLLLSSCFGLYLILSRIPWFSPWLATTTTGFSRALVYHVNFAVLIWFLAMTGALITRIYDSSKQLSNQVALVLSWVGTVILLVAGISGTGQTVLSNYIPVLHNTVFISGLALLGLGAFILASHGISTLSTPQNLLRFNPIQAYVAGGSFAWFAALIALLVITWRLAGVQDATPDYNTLFWASGHILQLAHVLLLLGVWLFLTRSFHPTSYSPWLSLVLLISILPAMASLIIVIFIPIPSSGYLHLFTNLMEYTFWWPVPGTILTLWPGWPIVKSVFKENNAILISVFLSIILLIQGIIFGMMIDRDTVLVTAHYHAAVGAVTLGYMGLVRHLLSESQVTIDNHLWLRWQPWMFGIGVILLTSGLEILGIEGVERKIPGLTTTSLSGILGMVLAGAGGSLAMAGVVVFSLVPLTVLVQKNMRRLPRLPSLFHHRFPLLIITVFTIAILAQLLERMPSTNPQATLPAENSPETSTNKLSAKDTLQQRFLEGALLLQAKRYNEAMAVFHGILQEYPRMPEARVNLGYALLGVGKIRASLDAFQEALLLNPYQTNAYYGLAIALESEGNLEMALGAMRSFIHMSPDTDPWLPRARSAVWEWESELKKLQDQSYNDGKHKK
ncbi:MAG: tetratricopeptide repeat protein [Magnetococcales bacterium]|nr:tetratricopeptide repeat protein [Magnetococcales bacterium]